MTLAELKSSYSLCDLCDLHIAILDYAELEEIHGDHNR
ncbi:hypothetical protein BP63_35 [Salmonella phage BP63]|uniref:Uncharacterized protein n=3 Tax=Rosemountvirus TaxID=2733127 RepID=A0A140XG66_9CAUD|nr:hypothetical protein BJD50_gp35 [Salmonella phage BP63]AIT13856.1 hypothetical protein BP63_35 [Salmonella phage BP63]QJQ40069.1 hypothetical protein vBSenM1_69 [Salmonella phage vB_SenM-1]